MDIEHQNADEAAGDKDKHSGVSYDDAIAAVGKAQDPLATRGTGFE